VLFKFAIEPALMDNVDKVKLDTCKFVVVKLVMNEFPKVLDELIKLVIEVFVLTRFGIVLLVETVVVVKFSIVPFTAFKFTEFTDPSIPNVIKPWPELLKIVI